jgi:acyl-CoA synthetase (AMP-forming)/AMP-acid ligase II
MESWNCLQDVLRDRAGTHSVLCYPLGDTSDPVSVSYKDLYVLAQHNGAKIRSLQRFKENHPILPHFDSHIDTIIWFWSVLLANGIPVILGPSSHGSDHISRLSVLLEAPICIIADGSTTIDDVSHGMYLYRVECLQKMESPSTALNSQLKYQGGSATAALILTSGSSGDPKAVILSHGQVLAAVAGKAAVRPLTRCLPFLNWIGLDHVASLVEIHIQALWLDVDQVHVHEIGRGFETYDVSITPSPPQSLKDVCPKLLLG